MQIELTKPIKAHGETLNTLTFTEPTIGILEGVKLSFKEDGVSLDVGNFLVRAVAECADIPPSAAKSLSFTDLGKCMELFKDFLPEFLPTGK